MPARRPIRPVLNRGSWQANGLRFWMPARPHWPTDLARQAAITRSAFFDDDNLDLTTFGHAYGINTHFPGFSIHEFLQVDGAQLGSLPAGDHTILVWTTYVQDNDIISNGVSAAGNFLVQVDGSSKVKAHLWTTGGSGIIAGSTTVPTNTFVLIGQRVKGATIDALLNGSVDGTTTITGSKAANTGTIYIGSRDTSASFGYVGDCVDVRIYDRALSDAELRALYEPRSRWDLYWTQSTRAYSKMTAAAATVHSPVMRILASQGNL